MNRMRLLTAFGLITFTVGMLGGAEVPSAASKKAKRTDNAFNRASKESIEAQAKRIEAQVHIDRGYNLLAEGKYSEARREAKLAIRVNPDNPDAVHLLDKVNETLGYRRTGQEALKTINERRNVLVESQLIIIDNAIREAQESFSTARNLRVASAPTLEEKEKLLSERLKMLHSAMESITRAQEAIAWLPTSIHYSNRGDVAETYKRIKSEINRTEQLTEDLRRQRILYDAQMNIRETEIRRGRRIEMLMERCKKLFEQHQYKQAEQVAKTVLKEEPLNTDARKWRDKAAGARMKAERKEQLYERKYSIKEAIQDLDSAHIPDMDLLTYPKEWDMILARAANTTIAGSSEEEAWKRRIREKLKKPVSFEFSGQSFKDAIDFLANIGGVNIIIDPQNVEGEGPPINLHVENWSLELALKWVLRQAELDMDFRNNAIFISTPEALDTEGKRLELKIYDIQDITMSTRHFISPELVIGDQEQGASTPWEATGEEVVTAEVLSEFIQANIAPQSWDLEGALIQESQGRIIVANKRYVHELIQKFLSDFRSTQKLLVNVEARFLQLRQADFTEVGVEWTGLNPQEQYWNGEALVGDFGDLTGMNNLYNARGDSTVAPVPGLRTPTYPVDLPTANTGNFSNPGPGDVNNAYALIGAMVNSNLAYANTINGAAKTISAMEGNVTNNMGQVTNSGFHGQITFMDGVMGQALVRALMAKEDTSLLFAPRLTVRNGQRAYVFVARQFHYVKDWQPSGDMMDPVIGQLFSGIILDVRPIVSYDRRYITMDLRPSVTQTTLPRSVAQYGLQNLGGDPPVVITIPLILELPSVEMQKVRSSVTIPDGGVVYIGGLYSDIRFKAENGMPIISDLPIIGRLFRYDVDENMRINTAIMVSGQIIMFEDYVSGKRAGM